MMRKRRFVEAEAARDHRLDGALHPQFEQLTGPSADAVDLAPHVPEIDTEHALVRIHEGERIERNPWRAREQREHAEQVALLTGRGRGNAERAQPSGRGEHAEALLP